MWHIRKKIDGIIIAIPSANTEDIKAIIEECKRTKCKLSMLPTIYTMMNKEVKLSDIRDVQIEDLLGREQVKLNMKGISSYLKKNKKKFWSQVEAVLLALNYVDKLLILNLEN